MKFFDTFLCQKNKGAYAVCGDYCTCERTATGMIYVLCDGIGSGIYANLSAINCADRILELVRNGMSVRLAGETVAASMHRARKEDIPFSAFYAAIILPNGQFTVYSYEVPNAVLLQGEHAAVLIPRYYTAGFEVIGEVSGTLHTGDSLIMFSDGVSQAGMGRGYGMGIGSDGVSDYVNRIYKPDGDISELPERIAEICKDASGGRYEDDTTIALIHCREAKELTLLSGPPSKQSMDGGYVSEFLNMPGLKIVCGGTTTDIVARESGLEAETLSLGKSFG
ncbi:MAG: serine/threonine-protein phosphatase, partial [Clostridiales bacterium]|nr:serine/threonine-protein phosphatase [Clostridiales bacterium]